MAFLWLLEADAVPLGPQGTLQGPGRHFPGHLRAPRSDPRHCGMLGSRFARPLPPRGPGTPLVPWAIPAPLVARALGGNSLAFSPGSLWMALGGAGRLQGGRWLRLALGLPPPSAGTADTSQGSRGCLIRRHCLLAYGAGFCCSGCSQEAMGEARVTGLW